MRWRYKAFDANFKVHTGTVEGDKVELIALNLRQQGLQLMDLEATDQLESAADRRLRMMKQRVQTRQPITPPSIEPNNLNSRIRRALSMTIRLLGRLKNALNFKHR